MSMAEKVATLWPELIITAAAFVCMIMGLSRSSVLRRGTAWLAGGALAVGAVIAMIQAPHSDAASVGAWLGGINLLGAYVKVGVCLVGLVLLIIACELPDEFGAGVEKDAAAFDPAPVARGEFYGFFLLSLVGTMLCAGSDSLIWLFLALELTSLPTYVMIAITRDRAQAPEAAVKYFFLGALAVAVFLYGFALIYGATGCTELADIANAFATHGIGPLALVGLVLAIVGLCFKIAAVPLHFYAADVYQGAASVVTALLAFVPKTAGFIAIMLLLATVGWPLRQSGDTARAGDALHWLIWVLAVATMFAGNTLALRQKNVKRVLAYSSIAHSGYMLIGLLAGPGEPGDWFIRNGLGAVLFYLITYGVMNAGAFAVLGTLRSVGDECQTFDDLRGLARRQPGLAAVMAICLLSLTGIPPLVGFWGKAYLFGAAISGGYYLIAVLGLINSAIAAAYYLHIVATCYIEQPNEQTRRAALAWRGRGAVISAVLVIVLSLAAAPLMIAAAQAGRAVADQQPTPPALTIAR